MVLVGEEGVVTVGQLPHKYIKKLILRQALGHFRTLDLIHTF